MILAKRRFTQVIDLPPNQFYDSKHPPLRVRVRTLAITILGTLWLIVAWLASCVASLGGLVLAGLSKIPLAVQLTGLAIAAAIMVVCIAVSAAAATVANGIAGELLPRPVAVA